MQPSKPNECGVLDAGLREVVATHGRGYAAIRVALCEDGPYRIGVEMHYAHGGFAFPISIHAEGFSTLDAARTAALELLLRSWHDPFPSEPDSVRTELVAMRAQVEARLRQPTLF
ncbi:MAG: hypothetical protein IPM64_13325 [Phycisphaerales bacterium]|nr:hypothetical protein [Phycisphaerales bacterium]